jgi:hypothetical protein
MSLCRFKDILGVPGKGLRQYRLFNIAIIDVIGTILLAFLVQFLIVFTIKKFGSNIHKYIDGLFGYIITLLCLIVLGIILHRVFCVNTTVNKYLFGVV